MNIICYNVQYISLSFANKQQKSFFCITCTVKHVIFSYLSFKQLTIFHYLRRCKWTITSSVLLHIFLVKKAEWKRKKKKHLQGNNIWSRNHNYLFIYSAAMSLGP